MGREAHTSKGAQVDLDSLSPELANLRAVGGDAMMQAAFAIVRERLDLTPEKLALMILRAVAPHEIITEGDECKLRGVSDKTLRGMKDRGELPRVVNAENS